MRLRSLSLPLSILFSGTAFVGAATFTGRHFDGEGDIAYLQQLDICARMFEPDPQYQNLSMLYMPAWNGLVEGPTWDAWWIQNSYGTTYCALPFLREPFVTFLQNSQALWFDQMGDGQTHRPFGKFDWVPPDGCLCDAARPGMFIAKQGDGRVDIHDWCMEFTAAGVVMQGELLLISRDQTAISKYLPKLERSANFIETRRDPKNNLFLAGPAGNLLAPSFAGWKKPDGTYDKAYLAGLSITYIAGLDRLIELETLAGRDEQVRRYAERRRTARLGLARLTTDEGYFLNSIDPDGTRHGVYGAAQHGYFESSPNHDAIAFRVADDVQAARIYAKIAAIPGLRPHAFIIPNYPSYDDMYEQPAGLWAFGTWVNGGHWSTCEGRMLMAYSRLGKYDDIRASMKQLMTFVDNWRMDNPLTQFGGDVYQPGQPVNLCYDTFAPAAAMIRGLFEYVYSAQGVQIIPHIPPEITRLTQRLPIRFGRKRLFLSTSGSGRIQAVQINGKDFRSFDEHSLLLNYDTTPDLAIVHIAFEGGGPAAHAATTEPTSIETVIPPGPAGTQLGIRRSHFSTFVERLVTSHLESEYEVAHARLVLAAIDVIAAREAKLQTGVIRPLAQAERAAAAQRAYIDTADKLSAGFEKVMEGYASSTDERQKSIARAWAETK